MFARSFVRLYTIMTYRDRLNLYREIEGLRKRPLITYVTSSRPNASAQMAPDVIPHFIKQIIATGAEPEEVDVLIVSNGGDANVAWRVISLLRERFKMVGALLPYGAYSAATLVALGADEIVMHPFANLGPVDPQLTAPRRIPGQGGQPDTVEMIQFGSEDLNNFFDFVRSDVGISDQEQLARVFELVCKDVGSMSIGVAKRSSQLALAMSEQLLNLHMKDSSQARAITEKLNRSFYHHGYPLGLSEAKKIGLPVVSAEGELGRLIWAVWEDLENEMECNMPFDPLEVVLSSPDTAALIGPALQIQLPANLPAPLMEQAYNNILQQIQVVAVNPVDYEHFQATVESIRCRSNFRTKGKISAVRLPDMNIAANIATTSRRWTFFADEGKEA